MIYTLFSIVAPVFVCAAIGYGWARFGGDYDVAWVTRMITSVGAPCLVFHTLVTLPTGTPALAQMVMATAIVAAVVAVVSAVFLRLAKLSIRAFLPALVFPNTGNMGLPLNLLAFGETGLGLAIGVFCVYTVGQMTVGIAIASGTVSLKALARVPLLYAVAAALVVMLGGVAPPQWILKTTELLGGLTIPLMLITLGVSLANLRVKSVRRSLVISMLRLGLGFAVGLGVASLLGLEGVARGVLIVQSTMPVAVFNYLFAQRYDTEPGEVAGTVVLSTLISFAILPALLWYVL